MSFRPHEQRQKRTIAPLLGTVVERPILEKASTTDLAAYCPPAAKACPCVVEITESAPLNTASLLSGAFLGGPKVPQYRMPGEMGRRVADQTARAEPQIYNDRRSYMQRI